VEPKVKIADAVNTKARNLCFIRNRDDL
jgi:hypothetical protein